MNLRNWDRRKITLDGRTELLLTMLGVIALGCSRESKTLETVRQQVTTGITNGVLRSEIAAQLDGAGSFEFSVTDEEGSVSAVSYAFVEPYIRYYFIFRNEYLEKIIPRPERAVTVVPYKGAVAEELLPVDPWQRVHKALDTPDIGWSGLVAQLKTNAPASGESLNALPFMPLLLAGEKQRKADYERNAELVRQFDPLKIRPGASLSVVSETYGRPLRKIEDTEDSYWLVFGSLEPLRVNPLHRFRNFSVRIEKDEVIAIFSGDYFDDRLIRR